MALNYPTTDTFAVANYNMSAIPQVSPPNMTLIPNSSKPDILAPLIPKTAGPMSAYSTAGYPISVPTGTPLSALGPIPDSEEPSTPATYELPTFAIDRLGSGDKNFDIWRSIRGKTSKNKADIDADYEQYIKQAGYAAIGSAVLQGGASLLEVNSARKYRKDVEKTKSQYETQKKIIDANIDNTEAALLENLRENMANLDVMTAAKNVDISSQAIQGDKVKGAMDLGEDIAAMHTNGALQKAALDLEYAMNVRKAKQQELDSYVNSALNIGVSALAFL